MRISGRLCDALHALQRIAPERYRRVPSGRALAVAVAVAAMRSLVVASSNHEVRRRVFVVSSSYPPTGIFASARYRWRHCVIDRTEHATSLLTALQDILLGIVRPSETRFLCKCFRAPAEVTVMRSHGLEPQVEARNSFSVLLSFRL